MSKNVSVMNGKMVLRILFMLVFFVVGSALFVFGMHILLKRRAKEQMKREAKAYGTFGKAELKKQKKLKKMKKGKKGKKGAAKQLLSALV